MLSGGCVQLSGSNKGNYLTQKYQLIFLSPLNNGSMR